MYLKKHCDCHNRRRNRQPPCWPWHNLIRLSLVASNALVGAFTITTFNILAPVHRSMGHTNRRESEREDWWRPRAEAVASYISEKLASSDVILLQEWWFDDQFSSIFDSITGHLFDRVAERRPGGVLYGKEFSCFAKNDPHRPLREDGMCCLINKNGKLDLVKSEQVLTGPQRIAQIVQCKEKCEDGRDVFLANTHLSFPHDEDSRRNDRRQAFEITLIQRALSKARRRTSRGKTSSSSHPFSSPNSNYFEDETANESLEVICGDFNSEPTGLAASQLEARDFVNCASAISEYMGVTHFTHRGEEISADHIFIRSHRSGSRSGKRSRGMSAVFQLTGSYDGAGDVGKSHAGNPLSSNGSRRQALAIGYQDPLSLGYIDMTGTQVINVRPADIQIRGNGVISDHKPVTATFRWPKLRSVGSSLSEPCMNVSNATMPLDPLSYLCANTGIL
mmetsp:Transcript_3176/g.7513  ORF Transcript_3176/g.7513 Transcript_3176/m.7513 type:complete len:449 (-) Transcript_3176:139-1485(-)